MCPNVDHHFQPYPQSKMYQKREKKGSRRDDLLPPIDPKWWVAGRALSQQNNSLSQRCCFQNTNEQRFGWFKAKKGTWFSYEMFLAESVTQCWLPRIPIYSLRIKNGWKIPHSWMIFQARNLYFIADVPSKPPFIDDFPSIFPRILKLMFQLTSTIIIIDHFPIQKAAQRCPCRTSSPPGCAKDCVTSSWESVGCSDNSHLGVLEMVVTINRWYIYI